MAEKDKVPVVAIRQIIKMRSDEYHNYSYRAIAERIKDEFGIEVTPQAIGYLYRKHKDSFTNQSDVSLKNSNMMNKESSLENENQINQEKKPLFKSNHKSQAIIKGFNKSDNDIDLSDLLKEAE